jgi:hypothetical protein
MSTHFRSQYALPLATDTPFIDEGRGPVPPLEANVVQVTGLSQDAHWFALWVAQALSAMPLKQEQTLATQLVPELW